MKPKTDKLLLPPFLFPGETSSERAYLAGLKKKGLVRSIGPKLYTSLSADEVKKAVRGSWSLIVSTLYPNALVSHATALTFLPTSEGEIFLTSTTRRDVELPGLTLRFLRGPKARYDDADFLNIKASSFERALLENFSSARGRLKRKVLDQRKLEERIYDFLEQKGEHELTLLRKRAHRISKALNLTVEFKKLDHMIGALLGTRSVHILKTNKARARGIGEPYDENCFARLEVLYGSIRHQPFKELSEERKSPEHFLNKAFFESYFSNYIEGTVFELEEAASIVFDRAISQRPLDAHDILGTFRIVSDLNEMRKTPKNEPELESLLKARHFTLLRKREDFYPGHFKSISNRAGNTVFVQPENISGTLNKGFQLYQSLPTGLARAIFMMFLISEVHPFADGNGRIARIMMNAELVSQNKSTIIIPNVYREDYLLALRALTRRSNPAPFVKMLIKAHEFSAIDFTNYVRAKTTLEKNFWFSEPGEARLVY